MSTDFEIFAFIIIICLLGVIFILYLQDMSLSEQYCNITIDNIDYLLTKC